MGVFFPSSFLKTSHSTHFFLKIEYFELADEPFVPSIVGRLQSIATFASKLTNQSSLTASSFKVNIAKMLMVLCPPTLSFSLSLD